MSRLLIGSFSFHFDASRACAPLAFVPHPYWFITDRQFIAFLCFGTVKLCRAQHSPIGAAMCCKLTEMVFLIKNVERVQRELQLHFNLTLLLWGFAYTYICILVYINTYIFLYFTISYEYVCTYMHLRVCYLSALQCHKTFWGFSQWNFEVLAKCWWLHAYEGVYTIYTYL